LVGTECLKCIQCFLNLRSKALAPVKQAVQVSQDEFGFDDFDMNDPALNELIGYRNEAAPFDAKKAADSDFATYVKNQLSPSIWKLLSAIYMPDLDVSRFAPTVGHDSQMRADYVIQVVQCWTACASVLIDNRLKVRPSGGNLDDRSCAAQDWDSYIVFGDETYKRIADPLGRREVGMLFGCCLFDMDFDAFNQHCDEFIGIWFESLVARRLTQQHRFTNQLLNSLSTEHAMYGGLQVGRAPGSDLYSFTLETLKLNRAKLIEGAVPLCVTCDA
jgi:hypothetical protein